MIKRHELANGIIGYEMGLGKKPVLRAWCYRVGSTLIDAGPAVSLPAFLPLLLEDGPIKHIFVTHHHEDHSGGAAQIRAKTGARITGTQFAQPLIEKGFRQYPYQLFYWGKYRPYPLDETLVLPPLDCLKWSTPDGEFVIIHAPGHSHDMTVVWDKERKALLAADLFLAPKLKVMRRDEVWAALEKSLARVLDETDIDLLLCAHRPVMTQGKAALEKKYNWMRSSREQIHERIMQGQPEMAASREVFGQTAVAFERIALGNVSQKNMLNSLQGRLKARADVVRRVGERWALCEFL